MKKEDLKGKNKTELEKMLAKAQKNMLDLRMDNAMQKLKNPHTITLKKKELARIKTQINIVEDSK
jgi:ribosomal protein L29